MRCPSCQQNTPVKFKMGSWGIPFQECAACSTQFYSEIADILDRGERLSAKSIDEYLEAVAKDASIKERLRKPSFITYSSSKASTYYTISMTTGEGGDEVYDVYEM